MVRQVSTCSYEMQSWQIKARICKHILTARQRLDESLLCEGHTDHTRTVGLVDELLVLARQADKLAAVLGEHDRRCSEGAPGHAGTIGFQTARGNAVDEQLKLRDTWAAFWRANDVEHVFPRGHGLGYVAVPPRTLNELPDQGIGALIDLIMLIEYMCEWPNLCNRIVFIAKAVGGVRPIGLLFAIMRVQCKLRATQVHDVERCVWEEQAAWSGWATADGHAAATILCDLLKAFDHVAYQKLIDAAVRTRFPVRQLKLLLQLYQAARHVELDGVAGEALQAQRRIIPVCASATTLLQLLLVGPLREVRAARPTVSIRVVVDLSLKRFGGYTIVAQELERASTWPTSSYASRVRDSHKEV